MIGMVRVVKEADVSEPMKASIALLWPQKGLPELRARSGSSRKLA